MRVVVEGADVELDWPPTLDLPRAGEYLTLHIGEPKTWLITAIVWDYEPGFIPALTLTVIDAVVPHG